MNNDLLLKRIDELCTEKGVKKTTAFTESHVGKNFASNLIILARRTLLYWLSILIVPWITS